MKNKFPQPSLYTPRMLESLGDVFLKKYNPKGQLPIDLKLIVEKDLKIPVLPRAGLAVNYRMDGYLALSPGTIYVEQTILDTDSVMNERRYRFILAREVGHLLLHKEFFTGVRTPEDHLDAVSLIPEEWYRRMDWDAQRFAQSIFMPAKPYRKHVLDLAVTCTTMTEVLKKLCETFNVNECDAFHRLKHLGLFK